jgi:adenosylcobyric acid synthase
MIQGTMSNVGKSFVVAALCRILVQDGYKVAPFKSQNMALNSFITEDGLEMGRAQVMQAEAAKIKPDVRMNPILLKPTSDKGSQVIVNGKVVSSMQARDYFQYKKELFPLVQQTYDDLAKDYDVIVLEGAGSPAEINLKQQDLVNMGMAKMAKAPVLLVGDIDRGGVFASLAGTMLLLEEEEQALVKGMMINKFRGDVDILKPGLDMISERLGLPVLGVMPYISVDIEDEDSLSERLGATSNQVGVLDIVVIRLPKISNFTDFNRLESIEGVTLRYVSHLAELKDPDLIILPGTKNTIADLLWLRQSGLEAAILKHAAKEKAVLGICGGYQMLGVKIEDEDGQEHGGTIKGMGLLPLATNFGAEKTTTRVKGHFEKVEGIFEPLSGKSFEGYEIHMGQTYRVEDPLSQEELGKDTLVSITQRLEQKTANPDGYQKGNIYGTYIHGILDGQEVLHALLKGLLNQKGIKEDILVQDLASYKEAQYDKLAQMMRESVDMEAIYRIIERGVDG